MSKQAEEAVYFEPSKEAAAVMAGDAPPQEAQTEHLGCRMAVEL